MAKEPALNDARHRLFTRFAELGIEATIVPYPAHASVEEGKRLRGAMAGTFTKNLLVRDRKDHYFLLAVQEDTTLDLKTLPARIGAHRRLSFASAEQMVARLGVAPGALTPLSLINASDEAVTVVLDAALLACAQVNFHPLINTESIGLHPAELLVFIRSTGHEPLVVNLDR